MYDNVQSCPNCYRDYVDGYVRDVCDECRGEMGLPVYRVEELEPSEHLAVYTELLRQSLALD